MFSERANDGIKRPAEQWFKRYNRSDPEKGGARKSRAGSARDWMDKTREAWEKAANETLEQGGLRGTDRPAQPGRAAGRSGAFRRPGARSRAERGT